MAGEARVVMVVAEMEEVVMVMEEVVMVVAEAKAMVAAEAKAMVAVVDDANVDYANDGEFHPICSCKTSNNHPRRHSAHKE
jgi:hypothetical protein